LKSLSQKIDWANAGIKVSREIINWPAVKAVRRAAICSYGYGGTVLHAVIEQAPRVPRSEYTYKQVDEPTALHLISTNERRVPVYARAPHDWRTGDGVENSTNSIGDALASRRGHHDFITAIVPSSRQEATELLNTFANGTGGNQLNASRVMSKNDTRVIWMFSGHGAQGADIGKELLAKGPVFRGVVEDLAPREFKSRQGFAQFKL